MPNTENINQKPSLKVIIIFYAVLFILLLIFAELFLSIFDREEIMVRADDPKMVYSLMPGKSGIAATPEYRVNVSIDSNGMRNCSEPQGSKKKNLLILGDSFAEGWGVECENSFPGILSKKLPDFQIWNAGAHGGTLSFYILRNRFYTKLIKPDHILLQIFDNDLDDLDKIHPLIIFHKNGEVAKANPKGLLFVPAGTISSSIKNLALFRYGKRFTSRIKGIPSPIKYYKIGKEPRDIILTHDQAIEKFGKLESIKNISEKYNGQFEFYKYNESNMPEVWKSRMQRFELYLNQFYREAKLSNPDIKMAILYIPAKEVFASGGITGDDINSSGKPVKPDRKTITSHNAFYRILKNFTEKNKIEFIDGINIYYENTEHLYFPGDAHLNSAGHSVTANAVIRWLDL